MRNVVNWLNLVPRGRDHFGQRRGSRGPDFSSAWQKGPLGTRLYLASNTILLMRKWNHAFLLLAIALAWKWQIASLPGRYSLKNKLGDRMIKQFLNSVVAKYRDLSVSRRSIICLSLRLRQIIDLLATDKSRYFAQPRPIIANYSPSIYNQTRSHACVPVDNRARFALSLYGVFLVPLSTSVAYLRRTTWPETLWSRDIMRAKD